MPKNEEYNAFYDLLDYAIKFIKSKELLWNFEEYILHNKNGDLKLATLKWTLDHL